MAKIQCENEKINKSQLAEIFSPLGYTNNRKKLQTYRKIWITLPEDRKQYSQMELQKKKKYCMCRGKKVKKYINVNKINVTNT